MKAWKSSPLFTSNQACPSLPLAPPPSPARACPCIQVHPTRHACSVLLVHFWKLFSTCCAIFNSKLCCGFAVWVSYASFTHYRSYRWPSPTVSSLPPQASWLLRVPQRGSACLFPSLPTCQPWCPVTFSTPQAYLTLGFCAVSTAQIRVYNADAIQNCTTSWPLSVPRGTSRGRWWW